MVFFDPHSVQYALSQALLMADAEASKIGAGARCHETKTARQNERWWQDADTEHADASVGKNFQPHVQSIQRLH